MRTEGIARRCLVARRIRSVVSTVLILLLVLGQSAYWSGGSEWLAHAVDHSKAGSAVTLEEHHDHVFPGSDTHDPEPFSDVEHRLLHQVEHAELALASIVPHGALLSMASMVVFALCCMGHRRNQRMFRPPRHR